MTVIRPLIRPLIRPATRSLVQRRGGGPPVDVDAAAWATAVTAAGGTYSGTTLAALSALAVSAKASGYWAKLNRFNPICGDQLAAALVPLKAGLGSATDTNVNFVGGDYTEATGLTGGGIKYLNTGLVASGLSLNDTHLAAYNRSSSTGGANALPMGSQVAGGAGNRFAAYLPHLGQLAYSDQYNVAGGGRVNTAGAVATPYGFLAASRTGAANHVIYRNGTSAVSNATAGGALPAFAIYVFALNDGGTAIEHGAHTCAGYSIGSGLTAGDVTAYNTHMQTFQTALGRNV